METNQLLDKLNEEQKLFTEMFCLSQEQITLLETDKPDEDLANQLLDIIDKRQQLMDKIDRLDEAINDLRKNGREDRQQAYIDKVNAIRTIINSIQVNDHKSRQKAQTVLNRMGDKVASARENKKAFNAYTNNTYHDAWFFDKKK